MLADANISRLADGALRPLDRLYEALIEPARRERAAIGALSGYLLIWTLYGVIAKSSQDLHQGRRDRLVTHPGLGLFEASTIQRNGRKSVVYNFSSCRLVLLFAFDLDCAFAVDRMASRGRLPSG